MRCAVVVQAAQGAAIPIVGDVALRVVRDQAVIGELLLAEGPREVATRILVQLQVYDVSAGQAGFRENHAGASGCRELLVRWLQGNCAVGRQLRVRLVKDRTFCKIAGPGARSRSRIFSLREVRTMTGQNRESQPKNPAKASSCRFCGEGLSLSFVDLGSSPL